MKSGRYTLGILIILFLSIFAFALISPVMARTAYSGKNEVGKYLSRCELKEPVTYRNLTIVPIRGPRSSSSVLTLDEALEAKLLTIKEINRKGSVNTLAVYNESKSYVYIMAGEILAGSKQDRVLKEDVLVPPDSGKVLVRAYCVERGRWTYKSDKFYSNKKAANISVRQSARSLKSQTAVWGKVAETNAAVDAKVSTDSLSGSYNSEKMRKDKKEYTRRFVDIPGRYPDVNGVIVLVNGKVLVADAFSSRDLFRKLWPKLYESYILEAIARQKGGVDSDISKTRVFIAEIMESVIQFHPGAGGGLNFEFSNDRVVGSGLTFQNSLVHLEAFPRAKARPVDRSRSNIQRNYNEQQINAPVNRPVNQQENQQVSPSSNVDNNND